MHPLMVVHNVNDFFISIFVGERLSFMFLWLSDNGFFITGSIFKVSDLVSYRC